MIPARTGLPLLLGAGFAACTIGCNNRGQVIDRNETVVYYTSEFIEDYFWWHRKPPRAFSDIKSFFAAAPVKPSSSAKITWTITDKKVRDEESGRELNEVIVQDVDGACVHTT